MDDARAVALAKLSAGRFLRKYRTTWKTRQDYWHWVTAAYLRIRGYPDSTGDSHALNGGFCGCIDDLRRHYGRNGSHKRRRIDATVPIDESASDKARFLTAVAKTDRAYADIDSADAVWELILTMPPRLRSLAYLFSQGYTQSEVAAALGLTAAGITNRATKLRELVARHMGERGSYLLDRWRSKPASSRSACSYPRDSKPAMPTPERVS